MITAEDEEAIKQRAIEEYLKLQRQNAADSADNAADGADGADGADSAAGDERKTNNPPGNGAYLAFPFGESGAKRRERI